MRNHSPASGITVSGIFCLAMVRFVLITGLGAACMAACSRARVESMTLLNQGVVLAQQGRYAEATEALQRAEAIDASNDQAAYNLALVHIEARKPEAAAEELRKAIAIRKDAAGYYEHLGSVLIDLQKWSEAKEVLESAIKLAPQSFRAYFKLGQVAEELDDPQLALQRYTEAIKRGPRYFEAYASLGRLYIDLGYPDHALQVIQSGQQVVQPGSEEDANLHQLLGTIHQQKRDYDQAIAEFRKALEIVPGMPEALFSIGWLHSMRQEVEPARKYLTMFVNMAAAEAPPHYVRAARDRISELDTTNLDTQNLDTQNSEQ